MKQISCGVVIINNNKILACKPYGKNLQKLGFDIPKGKMNKKETYYQTALRELEEETGIVLEEKDLHLIGKFKYNKKKDLILYLSIVKVDIDQCECTSYFKHPYKDKKVKEIVGYEWIEDTDRFYPNLQPILKFIKDKFFKEEK